MWLMIGALFAGAMLGALAMAVCAGRRIGELECWLDDVIDERDRARQWSRRWHALARVRDRQMANLCRHTMQVAEVLDARSG